ncbi:hypothetical protein LTR50_005505 [Elasticomyces elasticus]|nr:hypothetical protein LTR50_005505 [Elasticomyces elasticus]
MTTYGPHLSGHGPAHPSRSDVSSVDDEPNGDRDLLDASAESLVGRRFEVFETEDPAQNDRRTPMPKRLKEAGPLSLLILIGDGLLTVVPLFFFVLGITAATLHHNPTAGHTFGLRVEQATRLSLESLMASQSVWGTFESQLSLRQLTLGGCLLLLWALSPIGGQASLRLLEKQDRVQSENSSLRYLDTGPAAGIWPDSAFGSGWSALGQIVTAVFTAALVSPDDAKIAPQDIWGNVKIPRLEALDVSTIDLEGWINVAPEISVETYSSLVGLPTVGLPSDADSSYNLESSYISLNCTAPVQKPYESIVWSETVGVMWPSDPFNTTIPDPTAIMVPGHRDPTFFLDTYQTLGDVARLNAYFGLDNASLSDNSTTPTISETRDIVFGSMAPYLRKDNPIVLFNCSVAETHVETVVDCTGKVCGASKMRHSVLDTRSSRLSFMDITQVAQALAMLLPLSDGSQGQRISSLPEAFINSTSVTSYDMLVNRAGFVDLSLIAPESVSVRLASVLNTYFQISNFPGSFLGNLPERLSLYGPDTTPIDLIRTWFGSNATTDNILKVSEGFEDLVLSDKLLTTLAHAPFVGATSHGTAMRTHQVYVCNFVWLALLLISTSVLLTIGIVGIVMKERTLAPDMMGYVASMTYENPYVKVPDGGAAIDAMDRARSLKNLRVRIGDVEGKSEVGHIAFTAGIQTRRLEKDREYL